MRAFTNKDGSPKTHSRPRTCEHCRESPKAGCILPFRHLVRERDYDKMLNKPYFRVRKRNVS